MKPIFFSLLILLAATGLDAQVLYGPKTITFTGDGEIIEVMLTDSTRLTFFPSLEKMMILDETYPTEVDRSQAGKLGFKFQAIYPALPMVGLTVVLPRFRFENEEKAIYGADHFRHVVGDVNFIYEAQNDAELEYIIIEDAVTVDLWPIGDEKSFILAGKYEVERLW